MVHVITIYQSDRRSVCRRRRAVGRCPVDSAGRRRRTNGPAMTFGELALDNWTYRRTLATNFLRSDNVNKSLAGHGGSTAAVKQSRLTNRRAVVVATVRPSVRPSSRRPGLDGSGDETTAGITTNFRFSATPQDESAVTSVCGRPQVRGPRRKSFGMPSDARHTHHDGDVRSIRDFHPPKNYMYLSGTGPLEQSARIDNIGADSFIPINPHY